MFDLSTRFIRITTSIIIYNHHQSSVLFSEVCFLLFFVGRTLNDPAKLQECKTKSHFLFSFVCRGADSQAMDRDGRTALQYAIDGGTSDEDILALLEDHSR